MTKRSHLVALATVFALTGVSVIVAAQQRPNRVSDQQMTDLLSRMDTGIAAFRSDFEKAIDRDRINGSRAEDDINQTVKNFKEATGRLRDRVQNRRAEVTDVEDVMRHAFMIEAFMTSNALGAVVEHDWQTLRGNLDELARAYGVTTNWSGSRNRMSWIDDQQVGRLLTRTKKIADRFRQS